MAIEKKGKTDFLRNVDPAKIADTKTEKKEEKEKEVKTEVKDKKTKVKAEKKLTAVEKVEEKKSDKKDSKKKDKKKSKNGRPRKLLIDGEKEKSITLQLPKSLIKAMKKLAKKEDKSMKEIIGGALLEKYGELLKK